MNAESAVLPFQVKAPAPAAVPDEPYRRPAESELVRDIRHEIERIVDEEDKRFEDYACDQYEGCIDLDDVIKDFESNYSSRSIGLTPWDGYDGAELVAALKTKLDTDQIQSLIFECAEPQTCDYYIQWNEVASVPVGEQEYQIDIDDHEDLKDLVAKATDAELKELRIRDGSVLAYGNPCERIIWKLDVGIFLEAVAEILGDDPNHGDAVNEGG
jgi:hypothetical protein